MSDIWERMELRGRLLPFASVALFFLFWSVISIFYEEYIFPAPWETWKHIRYVFAAGVAFRAIKVSLVHVFGGFLLAAIVGILVGIMMGRLRIVESLLKYVVVIALIIPGLVLVIVSLIFFGVTDQGISALIFFTTLPYMVVNVWGGAKNVDANLIEMARVYGHSQRSIMKKIVLPGTLPHIISGLRVIFGLGFHINYFGEWIMGNEGFGHRIKTAYVIFEFPLIFAWGVIAVAVYFLLDTGIFYFLECRFMAWKKRAD